MTHIALWGANTARTIRPIWVLEELGLEYQLNPIGPRTGETQTDTFTALNQKQKIPFLQYRDIKLSESLAICRFLLNEFPNDNLATPSTAFERANEDEWCSYIYGEIDETCLYVLRRHYDLTKIYGEAPKAVEVCHQYLQRQFKFIEMHLSSNATLMTMGFGLCDIILVSCLDWARLYKIELPTAISQYLAKIRQRPAYKKAMKINYATQTKQGEE